MTDPKGTWSDGGKVWNGEPMQCATICPHCRATVLSTSQPIKEATAAQHFDLSKGEPARFVRNGILETCQCTDCAALASPPEQPAANQDKETQE